MKIKEIESCKSKALESLQIIRDKNLIGSLIKASNGTLKQSFLSLVINGKRGISLETAVVVNELFAKILKK